jgi:hypothetical protein
MCHPAYAGAQDIGGVMCNICKSIVRTEADELLLKFGLNWFENHCILLEDKARGGGKAERTRST